MGCASVKASAGVDRGVVEASTAADVVESAPLPFVQPEERKTWMVRIEKKDDSIFGFKTEITRTGLMIVSINHHGSLAEWNQEHVVDAVRPGDVIIGLNGEKDCRQIVKAIRSQILDLEIQRTVTHRVKRTEEHLVLASHLKTNESRKRHKVEGLACVCAAKAKSSMCAICLDEYEDPLENVLELPCKHAFHTTCIMQWFEDGKLECPLCKQSLWSFVKQSATPSPVDL